MLKNINEIAKYIVKNDGVGNVLIGVIPIFMYMKQNKDNINENLLRGIISNILKTDISINQIIEVMGGSLTYQKDKILQIYNEVSNEDIKPMPYDDMKIYGFIQYNNHSFKDLHTEIIEYTRAIRLKKSGFSKVNTKFKLNAPEFANYFYSRIEMVCTSPEDFFIYTNSGYSIQIDKDEIARIIYHMMNELSPSIWENKFETQALRAIQLSCKNVGKVNQHRNFMNLNNGMLNLDTFELLPHEFKYYSTLRIDINYNEKATCDRFRKYMEEITCNNKKLEMVLQEILGYCLTGETRAEKAFIFYGKGSNGKSVFAKIMTMIIGKDNVSNIPLRNFSNQFGTETIVDKIVNIATETELDDIRLNTENIKSIASGDSMHIQRKFKKGIDIDPMVKLIFLTNNLPRVNDTTKGFLRKIMIIPFNAEFKINGVQGENKSDNRLIDKLKLEKEGILLYALEGLKRLRKNNFQFTECEIINEQLSQYEEQINPTIEFFEDTLEVCKDECIHRPEVLNRFKEWARQTGREEWSKISSQNLWLMLQQTMAKHGVKYETKKVQGEIKVLNLKFKDKIHVKSLEDFVFEF